MLVGPRRVGAGIGIAFVLASYRSLPAFRMQQTEFLKVATSFGAVFVGGMTTASGLLCLTALPTYWGVLFALVNDRLDSTVLQHTCLHGTFSPTFFAVLPFVTTARVLYAFWCNTGCCAQLAANFFGNWFGSTQVAVARATCVCRVQAFVSSLFFYVACPCLGGV